MMKNNNHVSIAAICTLFIALIVCIYIISSEGFSKRNLDTQLSVYEQNYRRDLETIERNFELKINRLQEQIHSAEFVSKRRIDLLEEDVRRNKMDIQSLVEENKKLKARTQ